MKRLLTSLLGIALIGGAALLPADATPLKLSHRSSSRAASLVINWVGVIDNGEGDNWPHGPHGSLHILVYPPNQPCPGNQKSYPRPLTHVYLTGPSSGEWLDGDARNFNNLEIYRWRPQGLNAVKVFVYESDPGGVGRAHDPLFCRVIQREKTPAYWRSHHKAKGDAVRNALTRRIRWQETFGLSLYEGMPKMLIGFNTVVNPGSYNYR